MLGDYIRQLRQDKGLSSRAVARAAGVSPAYIGQVERGEIKVPSLRVLQALSRILDVEIARLIEASGGVPPEDLTYPPDARLVELTEQLIRQPELANIVELWPMLAEADRTSIYRAVSDLARLRKLIAEARQAVGEESTETSG